MGCRIYRYRQNGSLVVAFDDEDMKTVQALYQRGLENGVPDLSVIDAQEVRRLEPNINPDIKGALYAKSAGVISPWELAIAQMEVAVQNGVDQPVGACHRADGGGGAKRRGSKAGNRSNRDLALRGPF